MLSRSLERHQNESASTRNKSSSEMLALKVLLGVVASGDSEADTLRYSDIKT